MTSATAPAGGSAPLTNPTATLSIRNVTKRFGGVAALSELSIEVAEGELLGVIGPNGAGKSTLLSLINANQHPTSGEIIFDGQHRIDTMRTHRAARLGIARAHQIPRPFPRMTVRQNLLVASHSAGRRLAGGGDDVDSVLELCGLADHAWREAGTLTLLDLKRLEVARALALTPRLLLLDEVAAGLVAHEIDEITALIDGVHRRGVTIILVEHVQALVQALAERVVVLDFGRQIAEGTPREIAEDPDVDPDLPRRREAGKRPAPRAAEPQRPTLLQAEGVSVDYGKLRAAARDRLRGRRGRDRRRARRQRRRQDLARARSDRPRARGRRADRARRRGHDPHAGLPRAPARGSRSVTRAVACSAS